MSGLKHRKQGRVFYVDGAGMRLIDTYGSGFPWTEVDRRIMEYLKDRIRDGHKVCLADSGAPPEEIDKFLELKVRWKDGEEERNERQREEAEEAGKENLYTETV